MKRIEGPLPEVLYLEPRVYPDARGFFYESYHAERYADFGITACFVQDNHSRSVRGTVRGLHYQLAHPQAKLCRVIQGEVLDVVVDIRRGSPRFGCWAAQVLSAENRRQVFIPAGFAHGFLVLSETADFLYKCDAYYHPDDQYGILWSDPGLGIPWGLHSAPLLSEKDRALPPLAGIPSHLLPCFPAEAGGSRPGDAAPPISAAAPSGTCFLPGPE